MDFSLDETQQAVAELARDSLTRLATPERLEEQERGGSTYDEAAWKAMAHAGLLSLCLPRAVGGDGLGIAELALVLREIGRHTVPVPALATLGCALVVAQHGTPDQQDALLPAVAAGGSLLSAALREPSRPSPDAPATTARSTESGFVVDGVKVGVPFAAEAHRLLVPARVDGRGVVVLLVDPRAPGVSVERTPASSRLPEYTVRLSGVAAEVLGEGGSVAADLHRVVTAAACAVADGVVAGALELTTEHVRTREQFGRPLAAFQAVTAQVADVYIESRALHLAATSAAWRLSAGLIADADLDVAAYWAGERGLAALQTCHHLHGGLGVDVSYQLHRNYAWIKDLARLLGGASYRLERVGVPEAR